MIWDLRSLLLVIGGGSSYTPELMNGFIRRSEELLIDEIWLVDIPEGKEHLSVIRDLSRRMWGSNGGLEQKSIRHWIERRHCRIQIL